MSYKSNIPKIIKKMSDNEKKALDAIGLFVEAETKKRTPVDTGRLRSSYHHVVGDRLVRIGSNVQYSIFVEKGTRYQRPQPHLGPAMEQNKKKIQELAARYLGRGIE
jgi:HK97 gp10 family phage protein